jgi:hypothetical protein
MWGRSGQEGVRTWLPLAAASAAAIAAGVGLWIHLGRSAVVPTLEQEPAWSWNDGVRVDVCLSLRGALGASVFEANLQIEGTLLGSGALPRGARQPIDEGNVIGCVDEPQRYIDVEDDSRQTWRILYALTVLDPSPITWPSTNDVLPPPRATPALRAPATLRAREGTHVRFRFDTVDHAGKLASFMLLDESGPLIGVEAGWAGLQASHAEPFAVSWGRPLRRRPDECGERIARALQISGDSAVSVPPGETRSVALHGTPYRFMNVHSVEVPQSGCPDYDSWISWVLWRE